MIVVPWKTCKPEIRLTYGAGKEDVLIWVGAGDGKMMVVKEGVVEKTLIPDIAPLLYKMHRVGQVSSSL